MYELQYLKEHTVRLLDECKDFEQIRLIRALLMESNTKVVSNDDTAQLTKVTQ